MAGSDALAYAMLTAGHAPGVKDTLFGKATLSYFPPEMRTAQFAKDNITYDTGGTKGKTVAAGASSPAAQAAQAAGIPGSDAVAPTSQETTTNDSQRRRRGRVSTILNNRRSQLQSYGGGTEKLGG